MQKTFQRWLLPVDIALLGLAPMLIAQNMDRSDHGTAGHQMLHNAPLRAKTEKGPPVRVQTTRGLQAIGNPRMSNGPGPRDVGKSPPTRAPVGPSPSITMKKTATATKLGAGPTSFC